MKITKTEKIWLIVVLFFFLCYNLPFFPAYGQAKATLLHGLFTLLPLWICVYVGFIKICRKHRLKDSKKDAEPIA